MRNKPEADPPVDPKADLKTRLIDAAEAEIVEKGLAGLKAREVTRLAGCALGGLYNAFKDLDGLILQVNSRTLARLGAALVPPDHARTPEAVTLALADAYAGFAMEHQNLWSALFHHQLAADAPTPDWHLKEHEALIARIGAPLAALCPDLSEDALCLRVLTLFGAVHGVVHLALQDRLVGVPQSALRHEVAALVGALLAGARTMVGGEGLEPPTSSV